MLASIPASAIVAVTPGVISAGGSALDLSGLVLSTSTRLPVGSIQTFSSLADVSAYFGPSSKEYGIAAVYFLGFTNSNTKPGALLFASYQTTPVPAFLRGASMTGWTLTQLQAIPSGTLTIIIDGVTRNSATINLSTATSFSNAAAIIATAIGAGIAAYDSTSGSISILSTTTGSGSTIGYASGAIATALGMTQATGAMISQGAPVSTPAAAMTTIVAQTQNFASFMTAFKPSVSDCVAFAAWTNSTVDRFVYVMWDTDITNTTGNNSATAGSLIEAANYSGTAMLYESSDINLAAFLMGAIASVDFNETNGRTNFKFKGQTGIPAQITNQTIAAQLEANGFNYYGAWATANDRFVFLSPGQITGPFKWIDSYINQIWLNNAFQLAIFSFLTQVKSIPYNDVGYASIEAACMDPINQGLNFGAFYANVPLSAAQADEVNNMAGLKIDSVLGSRGWYLQIKPATPQVRAARGSPPITFFYMDGESVNAISLASINVQ